MINRERGGEFLGGLKMAQMCMRHLCLMIHLLKLAEFIGPDFPVNRLAADAQQTGSFGFIPAGLI